MRVTKWYCDMCGKEIEKDEHADYISIPEKVWKHGKSVKTIKILNYNNNYTMEFCEDCKATIAVLFGGSDDKTD